MRCDRRDYTFFQDNFLFVAPQRHDVQFWKRIQKDSNLEFAIAYFLFQLLWVLGWWIKKSFIKIINLKYSFTMNDLPHNSVSLPTTYSLFGNGNEFVQYYYMFYFIIRCVISSPYYSIWNLQAHDWTCYNRASLHKLLFTLLIKLL